ncbi:hypothetical protein KP509_30G042100 [Ceratopteris richardii]|uniref:FAD-binding PCMH-type domain-containing protein n=1 Tax=Ceratopteris richardii TaxID=49495 RepID=A0A8T2R1R1_CERRI|nr:hypothetical protein KP509_30G042100 [Ceratopteris richardii]
MKKENLPKLSIIITTVIASFFIQVAGNGVHLLLPPPIQCARSAEGGEGIGCTVEAYQRVWQDRRPCRAARAVYPTTEAQIFQAVAWASRSGSKIKVVSRGVHSITKLVCPDGDSGLLVSTHYYNSLIQVDPMSRTVTAHSGCYGVSVGGAISTGAHGSGLWGLGSALHDYVVGMRLVVPAPPHEGYARIIDLEDGHEDLDAARLSLGVLGVISTITFKLEPIFKRSVTLELKGDDDLEDEIVRFAKAHEFAGVNWYPGTRKVLYKVDDRVDVASVGNGAYNCEGITDTSMESITRNTIYTCFWNPLVNRSIFFYDVAISVPMSKAKDAITEIRKLRDLSPDIMCTLGLLGGLWIRFQAKSKAYMGLAHDSVMFEFVHYRAREATLPRFRQDLFEEIEQMLLNKFDGQPHWGKNRILAFDDMHRRVRAMEKFMQVKKKFPPSISSPTSGPTPSLEMAQHEEPRKVCMSIVLWRACVYAGRTPIVILVTRGHFCRPGRVFNEANVCKPEDSISISF